MPNAKLGTCGVLFAAYISQPLGAQLSRLTQPCKSLVLAVKPYRRSIVL